MKFSKACLKNVFTVVLIFIYLVLTAVAAFLAYQTISDFLDKLNHPVMSVTYKEVDTFTAPGLYILTLITINERLSPSLMNKYVVSLV